MSYKYMNFMHLKKHTFMYSMSDLVDYLIDIILSLI